MIEISFLEATTNQFLSINDNCSYCMDSSNMDNHSSHNDHNNYDQVSDSYNDSVC